MTGNGREPALNATQADHSSPIASSNPGTAKPEQNRQGMGNGSMIASLPSP